MNSFCSSLFLWAEYLSDKSWVRQAVRIRTAEDANHGGNTYISSPCLYLGKKMWCVVVKFVLVLFDMLGWQFTVEMQRQKVDKSERFFRDSSLPGACYCMQGSQIVPEFRVLVFFFASGLLYGRFVFCGFVASSIDYQWCCVFWAGERVGTFFAGFGSFWTVFELKCWK